jgi:hypothetical protein
MSRSGDARGEVTSVGLLIKLDWNVVVNGMVTGSHPRRSSHPKIHRLKKSSRSLDT